MLNELYDILYDYRDNWLTNGQYNHSFIYIGNPSAKMLVMTHLKISSFGRVSLTTRRIQEFPGIISYIILVNFHVDCDKQRVIIDETWRI